MRQYLLVALATLLVLPAVGLAATIHGTIYDSSTLEPVSGALVTINSTPTQTMVARPDYSFELPLGTYTLTATITSNGLVTAHTIETFLIDREGTFVLDLLLQAPPDDLPGTPVFGQDLPDGAVADNRLLLAAVVILAAFLVYLYFNRRSMLLTTAAPGAPTSRPMALPADLRSVLAALKRTDGRATQKDLRAAMKWSEAKMSLALDDLAQRGLVQKFKKGRGNIVRLRR